MIRTVIISLKRFIFQIEPNLFVSFIRQCILKLLWLNSQDNQPASFKLNNFSILISLLCLLLPCRSFLRLGFAFFGISLAFDDF